MARWTRQELLQALSLYLETPFGRQHDRYPPIIELATLLGRTPSAVAMKLCNFTSLDEAERARGISGLTGASKLDGEIWAEFHSHREHLVDEIEALREQPHEASNKSLSGEGKTPNGPTSVNGVATQRRHQAFFRRVVLGSYGSQCCVTGMPVPELLRASHIVPWSESRKHRLDPSNGLCLSANFDAAFDRGLIAFDDDHRLLIGENLRAKSGDGEVASVFLEREGRPLALPEKNLPQTELLRWHRENMFHRKSV